MPENDTCRKCKGEMKLVDEIILAGTKYKILKCENCNVQVARSQS